MLVSAGADPNQRDCHGRTAIYSAIERGSLNAVKELLKSGADVNQADEDGVTPMQLAANCKMPNEKMVKMMRKAAGGGPARRRKKPLPFEH